MPVDVKKFIIDGEKCFTGPNDVYIGAEMAFNNSIKLGDYIELIVPKGRLTANMGFTPGKGRFKVVGLFKTGYYEFDTTLIIMSLATAQNLYEIGDTAYALGVKVDDLYKMDQYAMKIHAMVGYDYLARTAEEKNKNFFYALQLEKLIMTVILFLIIISAGFTIMGTLVMVVMEKKKAIGILKAMGAKPKSIMVVFVMEGFLIGVTGTILGVVAGLAASLNLQAIIKWIEVKINFIMSNIYEIFDLGTWFYAKIVPTNVYYIDSIPTEVKAEFVVLISIIAVFLSTVAAVFPAWYASRLQPSETIRYE